MTVNLMMNTIIYLRVNCIITKYIGGNTHMVNQNHVSPLYEKAVSIEPVALVYSVETQTISQFMRNLLQNELKIPGVKEVGVTIVRTGDPSRNIYPRIDVVVFIDDRAGAFEDKGNSNVAPFIQHSVAATRLRPSRELREVLEVFTEEERPRITKSRLDNIVEIALDIEAVLYAMFLIKENGETGIHIKEVVQHRNYEGAIMVEKYSKTQTAKDIVKNGDQFKQMDGGSRT